jgi:glycerol-3-phosphate cytidylyltransferase
LKNKRNNIGIIAGNFDVIHPGYIFLFNECKENCDHLILFLHEDPSIERPEKLKPVLSLKERILILSSLRQIDEIIPYKLESDLLSLIKNMNIDVRFLGDDYINKAFTGKELNIPIHYLNRSHGWSTTKYKKLLSKTIKD